MKLQLPRSSWLIGSLLSTVLLFGGLLFSIMPTAQAQIAEPDTREFRRIEQPLGLKAGVLAAGAGLIGLELWWFLLSKRQ